MATRDDPDLERRARGERGEGNGRVVLPDEPLRPVRLVPDEAAPWALPLADDIASRPAELLGDAVRDLRQVVQVEAQVVGSRARLGAPVLDHLEMIRLGRRASVDEGGTSAGEELLDEIDANRVEGPVLAR